MGLASLYYLGNLNFIAATGITLDNGKSSAVHMELMLSHDTQRNTLSTPMR